MESTFFQNLLKTSETMQFKSTKDAHEWFRTKALEVSKKEADSVIKSRKETYRQSMMVGSMYFFSYDPKHKDTLPYFDRFPLIFPIGVDKDSYLGINVHYLPPVLRAKLMDILYTFQNNSKIPERKKLEISYQILKSSSANKLIKPCIKRYLKKHVRSRFMKVDSSEWNIALMLKVASFEKKSAAMVWNDAWKHMK